MAHDGRQYISWNSNRGSSDQRLDRVPFITNTANGKRYYSAVDAELYFGDIYIDEVASIQWSMQQQTLPLFGYNSYTFDDLALGTRLIQGQFAINFTEDNFLMNLQNNKAFSRIARRKYAKDYQETSVYSDYRKRLNLPVWDGGFDIVIGYGYHGQNVKNVTNTKYSTYTILDCCQITGSMLQLDYNGEPVREVYTFIARDMKITKEITADQRPDTSSGTVDTSTESTLPSKISLVAKLTLSKEDREHLLIYTASNIGFIDKATIKFTDTFNDKRLSVPFELTVRDKQLAYQFNKDLYRTLTNEIKNKGISNLTATVEFKYKMAYGDNTTDKNEYKDKATVKIPIEM